MLLRIEVPKHAGARDQAHDLARSLGDDLAGHEVVLECANSVVTTPSFLDEIVKQVLEERRADVLRITGASSRAQLLLERAAENRGFSDRLNFAVRA